ncbi:VirK/YbjX family protein [Sphingomonas nostoxanthinifaciens]|uniref:VirK/YbjX family protein n=1 Tax=Sphingomonas nostoxanthinifaciens TaxID=2872652 RepID=UPI001CC1C52F|nr:DUF535 family protein [Sphingomonas nostoxanthinifaciens]UAK23433.1 VirK/YbjX family protein [Sphingomonas nostoxanthinifaciens]
MSGTRSQVLRAGALRLAKVLLLSAIHHRALRAFSKAPAGSFLARVLADRPEIRGMVLTPYVCATWDAPTRIARVADHCGIAEELGPIFTLTSHDYARLIDLPQIGPGYHLRLDSPRWMTRDGLLNLSLWDETRRLYNLSFDLAHNEKGALIAYVGGVQGQRGDDMLDVYRGLTKAAHGMRPRDLTIELFRMLCGAIGVTCILAVSDENRYQRSAYVAAHASDPVGIEYDAIWQERGAVRRPDDFYDLPLAPARRDAAAIPPKKRVLYRKRYEMLDELQICLYVAIYNRSALAVRQWERRGASQPSVAMTWDDKTRTKGADRGATAAPASVERDEQTERRLSDRRV